jgi:hypothetical protein
LRERPPQPLGPLPLRSAEAYACDIPRDIPHGEALARHCFSLINEGEHERLLGLIHPQVEAILKVRPGEVLRGIDEVARFFHGVVAERSIFELLAAEVRSLDDRRVVVEGRMRWMDEDRVLRDDPVVWALEFEDGLLRRSTPVRTVAEAEALLSGAPRDDVTA